MVKVILIDPDGVEYDAHIDESGDDQEIQRDIIEGLGLEGDTDDYAVNLMGVKISEGSRIKIERRRHSTVKIERRK